MFRNSLMIKPGANDLSADYDYCMVFKMNEDTPPPNATYSQAQETKYIVQVMIDAGLEVFSYLSVQGDELLALIKAPASVLKKFADAIDYEVEMKHGRIKELLETGRVKADDSSKYDIKPVNINENNIYSPYSPYDFIFGKFDQEVEEKKQLYDVYDEHDPENFNEYYRLKLIYYLLKAPLSQGGCNLQLSKLINKGAILSFYPLHDQALKPALLEMVDDRYLYPWKLNFPLIREYYGEKIALYFCFMGHYSYWLIIPSIIGFIFQFVVWGSGNFSSPVLPFYCVIVSIWAIIMLEYWKREEALIAMKWGMSNFEEKEPDRPEYVGSSIVSYINGDEMLFFPSGQSSDRVTRSYTIILTFIGMVVGVVTSIYVLRFSLQNSIPTLASTVASILNTIQITVFNFIYSRVAILMTSQENHRTDTEYEDSLIVKLFAFQFVNSYASFFFLAFIAEYLTKPNGVPDNFKGQCGSTTCMAPLSINLAIIFGSRLIVKNTMDCMTPYIQGTMKFKSETKGIKAGIKLTPPEQNYILLPYNIMLEGINNYADAAIQFGFSMLFSSALPISLFLSLFSNYVRGKVNIWKMTTLFQRPVPLGAQDVGTWMQIFQFVGVISVVTNAGLVCFTMNVLDGYSAIGRIWVFIGIQWVLIAGQFITQAVIPDIPEEVDIQQDRTKFIVDKLIMGVPDEEPTQISTFTKLSLPDPSMDAIPCGCCCPPDLAKVEGNKFKNKMTGASNDVKIEKYPEEGSTPMQKNPLRAAL